LEGIEVRYLMKEETRNASRTCRRCGHVAQVKGMGFRCLKMWANRDLNAYVNIAHALMGGVGWESCELTKPAGEEVGVKPTLNAGSLAPQAE
jgi:transposase